MSNTITMHKRRTLRLLAAIVSLPWLLATVAVSAQDEHPAQSLVVDSTTRMLDGAA